MALSLPIYAVQRDVSFSSANKRKPLDQDRSESREWYALQSPIGVEANSGDAVETGRSQGVGTRRDVRKTSRQTFALRAQLLSSGVKCMCAPCRMRDTTVGCCKERRSCEGHAVTRIGKHKRK